MAEFSAAAVNEQIQIRLREDMLRKSRLVVQIAESHAPRKTGQLATSIGFDWNDANLEVVFTVGAPYGIFQEFGTRYIHPHPYLRPAINMVFGGTFGYQTSMVFTSTPEPGAGRKWLKAEGAGFHVPKGLPAHQQAHIAKYLIPISKHHFKRAVARSPMHARRQIF